MKENPQITISELAKIITKSTRTIELNITNLKRKEKIQRIDLDKGGQWKVN